MVGVIDRKDFILGNATKPESRPTWAPNEAPASRWALFFVLAYAGLFVANIPTSTANVLWKMDGSWYWLPNVFCTLLGFVFGFAIAAWLSRKILKTTLRELILGPEGTIDKRQCLRVMAAWAVGFALSYVVDAILGHSGTTTLNPVGAFPVLVNFIICSAFVWVQTTWEEVVHRCVFIRATCGNNIRPTAKCLAWGIVSTLIFMSGHFLNPEVTSQTDVASIVMACLSYFVAGMGMYAADVVYGSCVPGCAIHWINNFVLFAVITQTGSAAESAALFFTRIDQSGAFGLLDTVVMYLPLCALFAYDWKKMHAERG